MAKTKEEPVSKMPKLPTGKPTPKQLADLGDFWVMRRNERLAAEKKAKALQEDENKVAQYLIDNLSKGEASGIRGKVAAVWVETEPVPVVEDRTKFLAYVFKTKEYDLLTSAISRAAIKERWEAKKTVPGIGRFNAPKLHQKKV